MRRPNHANLPLVKKILIIILLSALSAFIPLTFLWTHHQFISGLNPFFGFIIILLTLLIAFFVYRLLIRLLKKYSSVTPDVLFVIASITCLLFIGVLQIFYGNSALDIHLHDTYYVVPNSYPLFFVALTFAIFAATYHWYDRIFKKQLNDTLGYIHFWLSFLGVIFVLLPMQYIQLVGMPRRYYDYSEPQGISVFNNGNTLVLVLTFLLIIAQLIFVFNVCYSIFRKPK